MNKYDKQQTRCNLSAAQAGIWLGQQILPDACLYGAAEYLPLGKSIDIARFHSAFSQLQNSADIFRLSLNNCSDNSQQDTVPVEQCISHKSPHQKLTNKQFGSYLSAVNWMKNDIATRSLYKPEQGLYRCSLIQYIEDGQSHWLFYMAIHHMICDGYGFNLLFKHLCALYNGDTSTINSTKLSTLPPVIEEDNNYRKSKAFSKDAQFWQQQLKDLPAPTALFDTQSNQKHSLDHVTISDPICIDLNSLKQKTSTIEDNHWADTCLALSFIWRFQKTGERDICLGLPVMNRYGSISARTPAMAMNIIPLRIKIDAKDTLEHLKKKVRSCINQSQRHQRYRYEDIRKDRTDQNPLFSTVINIQPYFESLNINKNTTESRALSSGPVDDLSLTFASKNNKNLNISFEYNRKKYTSEEIESFKKDWELLLSLYLSNPKTSIKPSINTQSWLSAPPLPEPQHPLRVIEERIQSRGEHPALIEGEKSISYRQLWCYAKQQAAQLQPLCQASSNKNIVLFLPRSSDAIIAMLGCWLSGVSFTVLDPLSAKARNEKIIEKLNPNAIIYAANSPAIATINSAISRGDHRWQQQNYLAQNEVDSSALSIDDIAYKIYTSGSTGTPKGVEVSHRALNDFIRGATDKASGYGLSKNDRVLQFAPLQFDACIEEIFVTLSLGASLVIRSESMINSCESFFQQCVSLSISVLDLPTAYWQELARYLEHSNTQLPQNIHTTIIGGEAVDKQSLQAWLQHSCTPQRLLNTYGPSEACVVASFIELTCAQSPISIGQPLLGRSLAILDRDKNVLPRNQPGELCIAGAGLADGYYQQDDLTQQYFSYQDSPVTGKSLRCYLTGDKVVMDPQGNIIYLGRIDDEIKISGQRIQPAEIQRAVESLNEVESALILIDKNAPRVSLIACISVTSTEEQQDSVIFSQCRQQLQSILPETMIPTLWFKVKQWPRTPSGKLDRRQLFVDARAFFSASSHTNADHSTKPLTALETQLSELWKKALGPLSISRDDDFFALGGQSLQTITLAESIGRISGRQVSLPDIFSRPTLSKMAELLASNQDAVSTNTNDHYLNQKSRVEAFSQLSKIPPANRPSVKGSNVFITGATGFVGRYLIKALLESSTATLTCIVRARDNLHARERILHSLQKTGLNNPEHYIDRLHSLAGDLSKNHLGLSHADYQSLADNNAPCQIIHNAASVSVMQDFSSLANSNVESTKQLIELAMQLSTPLLLVSTIATADLSQGAIAERFYPYHKGLKDGYQQSKWAAESLAEQAVAAGANIQTVRLGRVTSPIEGNEINSQDLFWRILHASLTLGATPELAVTEPWTPVDFVAKALTGIALEQSISTTHCQPVLNLCPSKSVALMRVFSEAIKYFSRLGLSIRSTPMPQWVNLLKSHSDSELQTLAGFFDMHTPDKNTQKNTADNSPAAMKIDNQHCTDILSTLKLEFVGIDSTLLQHYFDCAISAGLVPQNKSIEAQLPHQAPVLTEKIQPVTETA